MTAPPHARSACWDCAQWERHVDYLVPNRFEYGYGLTPEIVDLASRAARGPPDLLITVDNGIASVEGVARANELGISVLVTDHHLPGAVAAGGCLHRQSEPARLRIPEQASGGRRSDVLRSARAARRTACARSVRRGNTAATRSSARSGRARHCCRCRRLDRNNSILIAQGLQRIRHGRLRPGIAALFQFAGNDARIASARDLGFAIGPRINAAGRLTDMTIGIECLITDSFERAIELARQLDQLNRDRREIESDMQLDALAASTQADGASARSTICLYDEDWHQGVIGLVASRIKEKYHRPTVAFARASDGELRGSGRSIEGVHLRDTLDLVTKKAPALVRRFGGHAMAAGLSMPASSYDGFVSAFEDAHARVVRSRALRAHDHDRWRARCERSRAVAD